MSSQNDKGAPAKDMKAEGQERNGKMKAEGEERNGKMKAEGEERNGNMKAEGQERNGNMKAEGREEGRSQTTGQAGAGRQALDRAAHQDHDRDPRSSTWRL